MKYILFVSSLAVACPQFVEIFPDPTEVPDQQGEFVEIRMDSSFRAESLFVSLDGKGALGFPYPEGGRFVLSHGNALCPDKDGITCGDLGSYSLPNSRESVWKLQAKTCVDSIHLDKPKAGKSFQRKGYGDQWFWTSLRLGTEIHFTNWTWTTAGYPVWSTNSGKTIGGCPAGFRAARTFGCFMNIWTCIVRVRARTIRCM